MNVNSNFLSGTIDEMTDKEAAAILRDIQKHGNMNMGRGNLKSMKILRVNMAFTRAIEKLEEEEK